MHATKLNITLQKLIIQNFSTYIEGAAQKTKRAKYIAALTWSEKGCLD